MPVVVVDASGAGDQTLVAAVAGQRIALIACGLVFPAGLTARWKSGSSNISGPLALNAGATITLDAPAHPTQFFYHLITNLGEALVMNLSGGSVGGWLRYELRPLP